MTTLALDQLLSITIPHDRIATSPAHPRDSARLLLLRRATGELTDLTIRGLPSLLSPILPLINRRRSLMRLCQCCVDSCLIPAARYKTFLLPPETALQKFCASMQVLDSFFS